MRETQTTPVRRLTVFVCLLLAIGAVACLVMWFQATHRPTPQYKPQQVFPSVVSTNHIYAGHYCYAGEPRTTPAYPNQLLILTNIGYVVGYDEKRGNPAWVCYKVHKVSSLVAPPRPKEFTADARTKTGVVSKDYTGSGYDRGHQAPNYAIAVCYGAQAQLETFLMSNIIPQAPKLNRQVWEQLEEKEIRDYAQRYGKVWIITGPIFHEPARTIKGKIDIPSACFKIMIREENGQVKVSAVEIPQTVKGNEDVTEFGRCVRNIENETGLDFMSELPKPLQDQVETGKNNFL